MNVSTPAFSGSVSSGISDMAPHPESPLKSLAASTIFQGPPGGKNSAVKVPVPAPDSHVNSLCTPLSVGGFGGVSTKVPLEHPSTSAPSVTSKLPLKGSSVKSIWVVIVTKLFIESVCAEPVAQAANNTLATSVRTIPIRTRICSPLFLWDSVLSALLRLMSANCGGVKMRRCQGPAPRDPGLYTFASIHQIAEKVSSRKLIFSIL